ncbi:MAC/Perforin domain family protein [Babesia bovis T2Bo]|uniref:MAC/Perforin domain family protein n=1 Tax=Babesia bovis T2Bo TaxID=484906 RepID=UPI001C361694|nr:MAC/Perforin domain family protein [Babesia bovis T2Bo]EDO07608.2 MAC/Perforin domain family protein [Babesia bovis T2Bo]
MAHTNFLFLLTYFAIPYVMTKDGIKNQMKRTIAQGRIPAIEYLGCGYDILYGNPLADDGTLVDPGYRNPIISFTLAHHKSKGKKDLKYANIPGAWIRPLVACQRSDETSIVKSISDYQKALSVDSEVGIGTVDESAKFALSAGYAESSAINLSNERTLHIQRNYCFLLEAALPVNGKYAFKKSFQNATKELKPNFKKAATECTTIRYAINPEYPDCKEVKPWMQLFEMFGTHFTYNIKIGGRLTKISQVNLNKKTNTNMNSVNAGATTQVRNELFGASAGVGLSKGSTKDNTENISFTYVNVLGGRTIGNVEDENEYLEWINSIPEHPMPIRNQLAPLAKLFDSEELKETYDDAMEYYVELNGLKTKSETKEAQA